MRVVFYKKHFHLMINWKITSITFHTIYITHRHGSKERMLLNILNTKIRTKPYVIMTIMRINFVCMNWICISVTLFSIHHQQIGILVLVSKSRMRRSVFWHADVCSCSVNQLEVVVFSVSTLVAARSQHKGCTPTFWML